MSEYTTLQAMGLTEISTISHYKLSHKDNKEELKIYFKRPQGSSQPHSSTFCFDRNTVVSADVEAQAQSKNNGGSDPVLVAAIDELNILSKQHSTGDRRTILLNELDRLEQVMASKIQELREDLARI